MIVTSQTQQNVLAISSYVINLLFNTGNPYFKTLRLKAHSDALKKQIYVILDYAKLEFLSSHAFSSLQSLTI